MPPHNSHNQPDDNGDDFSVKKLTVILTIVASIIGAALFTDDRYAKAADLKFSTEEGKQNVKSMEVRIQNSLQSRIVALRMSQINDSLFTLDFKRSSPPGLTPLEEAQYNRYVRQLQDLQSMQSNQNFNNPNSVASNSAIP